MSDSTPPNDDPLGCTKAAAAMGAIAGVPGGLPGIIVGAEIGAIVGAALDHWLCTKPKEAEKKE